MYKNNFPKVHIMLLRNNEGNRINVYGFEEGVEGQESINHKVQPGLNGSTFTVPD